MPAADTRQFFDQKASRSDSAESERRFREIEGDDEEFVELEPTDGYRAQAVEMTAGKRLRIDRENAGLTLTRLSELSGIPQGNLSQLEHDKRPLGRMTARKLARHLACDYRSLL